MKYIYFIALFSILFVSCKKEVEKEKQEELKGYSSQGNLLVIEVADTFVNVIEYNLDIHPDYHWDSMPIYSNYFYFEDTLNAIVGWLQCVGHENIGYYFPEVDFSFNQPIFPVFYTNLNGYTKVSEELLINNQTQVELSSSKFKMFDPTSSISEFQSIWDKINNLRVTIQYRYANPTSQVGALRKRTNSGETRYYFFLAKY